MAASLVGAGGKVSGPSNGSFTAKGAAFEGRWSFQTEICCLVCLWIIRVAQEGMEHFSLRRDWGWDRLLGGACGIGGGGDPGRKELAQVRRGEQSLTLGEHELTAGQREKSWQRSQRRSIQRGRRRTWLWRPREGKAGILVRDLWWAKVGRKSRKMRREPREAQRGEMTCPRSHSHSW